jgi:hypothetical protein
MTTDLVLAWVRAAEYFAVPRLTASGWSCRMEGFDGLGCWDHRHRGRRLIHSIAVHPDDGCTWAHVSLSLRSGQLPSWEQTRDAWRLIYPTLTGIIIVPPESEHVDIAEVMHVWANLDRPELVPDMSMGTGSI